MALSAKSMVGLTHAARLTFENGRGEGLADVRRVVEAIGAERPEQMSVLMRAAGMDAMEVASLVRAGILVVADAPRPTVCERCNRPPTRGTTLCDPCRAYLGWAKLVGEETPEAPSVLRAPTAAGAHSSMHVRKRR